jgi:ferredoxin
MADQQPARPGRRRGRRDRAHRVYAAGDASLHFEPGLGTYRRTEHWEAAARQGANAAARCSASPFPPPPTPSVSSDQHGIPIQYLGDAHGADGLRIDGDPNGRDFTATFTRHGRPIAALLLGCPHAAAAMRRRLQHSNPAPTRKDRSMTLIPHIDELACAAHGDCALAAPGIFTIEDIAIVTGEGSDDKVLAAARACPAGAITVTDSATGEAVYP